MKKFIFGVCFATIAAMSATGYAQISLPELATTEKSAATVSVAASGSRASTSRCAKLITSVKSFGSKAKTYVKQHPFITGEILSTIIGAFSTANLLTNVYLSPTEKNVHVLDGLIVTPLLCLADILIAQYYSRQISSPLAQQIDAVSDSSKPISRVTNFLKTLFNKKPCSWIKNHLFITIWCIKFIKDCIKTYVLLGAANSNYGYVPQAPDINSAFDTLGLNPINGCDTYKKQYYKLAKIYHPDHGGSQEKMLTLNAAYELLKDFCLRKNNIASPA